jgi:ectoine hydroxylase-related dioxygenase (phytanoyl-CoA dioxygenase family)
MKSALSQQQIDTYNQDGFLVIPNFLEASKLETWRNWTQEAVDQRLASSGPLSNQADPDNFYAQVFIQCLKLADTHAGMRSLLLNPELGEMIATLAGADGIRIWHDQALFKPPFGNPTAWHLDVPYWSFKARNAISMWIALDDATLSNGCMYYLPGTHLKASFDNVGIGQNMAALFKVYPEWRSIEPVACPCPAGSAVFHNGLTAHGAGANMTNRPRRAMTCAYMPDGSTFNGTRNVLPEEYFNSLQPGDVLNDPVVNPLVWKKGE